MKTALCELSDWIDSQPQITRKLLKEKILELENRGILIKPKKETTRFTKPTIPQIMDYCLERQNSVDAVKFFDHYESKGWVVGKSPMKSWQAAIRTWEGNNKDQQPKLIGRQTQETVKNNLNFIPIQL
jgi:hypothetical protein